MLDKTLAIVGYDAVVGQYHMVMVDKGLRAHIAALVAAEPVDLVDPD